MSDTTEKTIVSAYVHNPARGIFKSKKSDRASCNWIECENPDCPLLALGQCMMQGILGSTRCPYGSHYRDVGPTQRAQSYSKWVADRQNRFNGVKTLKIPPKKMAIVGEWVYLPYSHMTMCKDVPFVSHSAFFVSGTCLIPLDQWTVDVVETLIDFRPNAMMGGEIKAYQREEVPLFIQHLREVTPEMFSQLVERRPEYDTAPDYVGRKAVLTTLNAPLEWTVTKNADYPVAWKWDGEKLRTSSHHAFNYIWGDIKEKSVEVTVVPKDGESVVVQSNDWVNDSTVFVD